MCAEVPECSGRSEHDTAVTFDAAIVVQLGEPKMTVGTVVSAPLVVRGRAIGCRPKSIRHEADVMPYLVREHGILASQWRVMPPRARGDTYKSAARKR